MSYTEPHGRHSLNICLLHRKRRGDWRLSTEFEVFKREKRLFLTLVIGTILDCIIKQMTCKAVEEEAVIAGNQNGFTKNWSFWTDSTSLYDRTSHVELTLLFFYDHKTWIGLVNRLIYSWMFLYENLLMSISWKILYQRVVGLSSYLVCTYPWLRHSCSRGTY